MRRISHHRGSSWRGGVSYPQLGEGEGLYARCGAAKQVCGKAKKGVVVKVEVYLVPLGKGATR